MATVTDAAEATFSFPILKTETTAEGDLVVMGKATDGTVDSDNQIVDSAWSSKALNTWLSTGANIRVQHNPHRDPAGVGFQVDIDRDGDGAHWLKALVVEPTAKKLVSKGALRAFSVGIMHPKIVTDVKARAGRIIDGEIGEISLVDRPANRNCSFTLVKADKSGKAAWIGALTGDPDFLAKQLTPTPADMARMLGKHAVEPGPERPSVEHGTPPANVFADPVATRLNEALRSEAIHKRVLASGEVVDSSGKDRSSVADSDFAGPGKTFPISSQGDVSDAASLAHHAKDPGAVRSRIRSIARRKWPDMQLPPSLGGSDDGEKAAEPETVKDGGGAECGTCHGSGKIMEGERKCPDCNGTGHMMAAKADNADDTMEQDDESSDDQRNEAADQQADRGASEDGIKAAKMYCPACGSKLKKNGSFCPGCGSKIAMPDAMKHVIPHSHPTPADHAEGKDAKPVPAHREPDGSQTEDFEADSGMQDGDEHGKKPAEPTPTWSGKAGGSRDPSAGVVHTPGTTEGPDPADEEKRPETEYEVGLGEEDNRPASPSGLSQLHLKMRDSNAPYAITRMHDALCAAYDGPAVLAEYPSLKTYGDAVDAARWRAAAQQVVSEGNLDAGQKALTAAAAAEALKSMDPAAVEDGRALLRKDFTSMYPDVHLSPGQISAQQFTRPYISEGHAPLSAEAPKSQPPGHVPPAAQDASHFTRGWISEGHQSPSPADEGSRPGTFTGTSMGHMSAPKSSAAHAVAVIHDHIAAEWSGVCPMSNNYMAPDYHKNGVDATGGAGSQIADQIRRHQQRQHTAAPVQIVKAEQREQQPDGLIPVTRQPKSITKVAVSNLTEDVLKSVLAAELAKVTETIQGYRTDNDTLTKQVGDLQEQLNQLGSQPDPYAAPPRSAVAPPPEGASSGAVPVDRRSLVDEAADKVRADKLQFLKSMANSGDPVIREGAQDQIRKLLMAP